MKSTSKTHDILRKEFYLFHFLRRTFYAPEHLFTWGVKWSGGCGKKTTSAYGDTRKGSTRCWNYLEVYWPYAGGLSAVNAIGTQLRDSINSGLTRWRVAVLNKQMDAAAERGRNPVRKKSTRFSLSIEMSRLTRDGTAEPVSRDQILRRKRGQGSLHFP